MNNRFFAGLVFIFVLGFFFISCPGTGTEKETYTVTIGSLTNGTITANPTSGIEGTEIVLKVTPSGGYSLKAGTIKYGTTAIDETTKKFNLPAENVTITAEFELIFTNPLIGIWENRVDEDRYMRIEFNENNEGTFTQNTELNGDFTLVVKTFTYSIDNSIILFDLEDISDFNCEYELSNSELLINSFGGNVGNNITFIKIST
jgi:hypothetical protein